MKIKRIKSLLYIVSSVMVLGLALVSFDVAAPTLQNGTFPAPTGTENTPMPSPTAKPTVTPTPTATPTPSPTPVPSLTELHAGISIRPATGDLGNKLTNAVTEYLMAHYSNEELQVKEINNITCYYKQGISSVDYFIYVTYDITYVGSNVPMPTLDEYLVTMDDDTVTLHTESEDAVVNESRLLSRVSKSVSALYIQELIQRYMNAKLACDEDLLSSIVTDPSYLNMESIKETTMHIMEYRNPEYIIHAVSDEVTEFDYIAYQAVDVKISTLVTLLPGIDEFLIKLDDENYPKIFIGQTSEEAENARLLSFQQEDYLQMYETVETRFFNAIQNDPDVEEFIKRINNATGN